MKNIIFYLFYLFYLFLCTSIFALGIGESTQSSNYKEFEYKDFNEIVNHSNVQVDIALGNNYSVIVKGNTDYMKDLIIELNGKCLNVTYRKYGLFLPHPNGTTVFITMPKLEGITISDSGNVNISGINKSSIFRINLQDSGNLYISDNIISKQTFINIGDSGSLKIGKIVSENMELYLTDSGSVDIMQTTSSSIKSYIGNSGNIIISGTVSELTHQGVDSGNFLGKGLVSSKTTINISDSGSAEITVKEKSSAWLSTKDSGDIIIYGNPQIMEKNRADSGNIIIK